MPANQILLHLSDLASSQHFFVALYQICSLFAPSGIALFCFVFHKAYFETLRLITEIFLSSILVFFLSSLNVLHITMDNWSMLFPTGHSPVQQQNPHSSIWYLLFFGVRAWSKPSYYSVWQLPCTIPEFLSSRWDLPPALCHISRFFSMHWATLPCNWKPSLRASVFLIIFYSTNLCNVQTLLTMIVNPSLELYSKLHLRRW